MTHERRYFAVGTRHRNTPIDPTREIRDAVLEIVVCDLHNV
jgi:hypothetical protein